jgi:hypothetical protein
MAEGWNIWNVGEPRTEIARYDDAASAGPHVPQLESDTAAWEIVLEGIRRGSPLHIKALAIVPPVERNWIAKVLGGNPACAPFLPEYDPTLRLES